MPRSKRNQVTSLTKASLALTNQVSKKTREQKQTLVSQIQSALSSYSHAYIIKVENERNTHIKTLRETIDGQLYFGKTRVMAVAVGTEESAAAAPGSHKLGQKLAGNVGLFFSNMAPGELVPRLDQFTRVEFARQGCVASEDVVLPEGPLKMLDGTVVPNNMEPLFRKLGIPTRLVGGVVVLSAPHVVCKQGAVLNSDTAHVLKLLGIRMAEFKVIALACFTAGELIEL